MAEALRDVLAVGARERIDLVAVDLRAQQQVQVLDRAPHRTRDWEWAQRHRSLRRHKAGRRTESRDAAERGRSPQTATVIRAGRERHLADCERRRRATGRTCRCLLRIERVASRAVDAILGIGAGAELRRVRLAKDDAAFETHAGDHRAVFLGYMIFIDQAALGRAETGRRLEVLHADRQAVDDPEIVATHHGVFGIASRLARRLLVQRNHGVDRPVGRADAPETAIEKLERRDLLAPDQAPQLDCG